MRAAISGRGLVLGLLMLLCSLASGSSWHTILTPQRPQATLQLNAHVPSGPSAFLNLGIEHILTGIDHLLFVFGLILIVEDRWKLLKTITAFTIAHSITLVVPLAPTIAVAAAVGLFDGAMDRSAEGASSHLTGVLGVCAAVFVLIALTASLIVPLRTAWLRITVRVAGSWLAALGLLPVGWAVRTR